MINNLSIVLSLVGVMYVAIKAAILDRSLPWFGKRPPRAERPRF